MKTAKLISLVVIVALTAMLLQPAPAEAIEPMTIITIVGAAVLVVTIIAVVVIANVRDDQRGASLDPPILAGPVASAPMMPTAPVVAVVDGGGVQGL